GDRPGDAAGRRAGDGAAQRQRGGRADPGPGRAGPAAPAGPAVDAAPGGGHAGRPGPPAHRRDPAPGRGGRAGGRAAAVQPADRGARRHRPGDVREGEGDDGGGGVPAVPADPAVDRAQRRLAGRPGRGLPRALPVLLPRRVADRPAGHPRVRRPRRHPGQPRPVRRHGPPPAGGGDDVRGLLLHRPARAGAPDRVVGPGGVVLRGVGRAGAAALDDEVRRRGVVRGPGARRAHPGPAQRERRPGQHPLRGRHRDRGGPAGRAAHAGPGRLPGRAHHRADHADAVLAGRVRRAAGRCRRRRGRGARPGPHRRADHPPVHAGIEGRAAGLVPADQAGDGRGDPVPQARPLRRGEVRLPEGDDGRAARLVHPGDRRAAARLPHPLLDL
ncbi:MAG: Spore photoproduct lyase, partial [uncultured Corynebacteriales bacterium]